MCSMISENWLQIVMYGMCALGFYKAGKYFGFSEGLMYLRKTGIHRSAEGHEHYCNITDCNVVCFEREGELWVKEYCSPSQKEGRTYMVFHCPWCGYQTEKSKMRSKVSFSRLIP